MDARLIGLSLPLVPCPNPKTVKKVVFLKPLPFGKKKIKGLRGGMAAPVSFKGHLEDKTAEALVPNAGVIGSVDPDKMLEAREKGYVE